MLLSVENVYCVMHNATMATDITNSEEQFYHRNLFQAHIWCYSLFHDAPHYMLSASVLHYVKHPSPQNKMYIFQSNIYINCGTQLTLSVV